MLHGARGGARGTGWCSQRRRSRRVLAPAPHAVRYRRHACVVQRRTLCALATLQELNQKVLEWADSETKAIFYSHTVQVSGWS